MKKVTAVIVQPCFLPWRGQFDLLLRGDINIFLDDVQYVRRSWYNRNRILTSQGPKWITVPVKSKGNYLVNIKDIHIDNDQNWQTKTSGTIYNAYKTKPYFDMYFSSLEELLFREWEFISDLSQASVKWGFKQLGFERTFMQSSKMNATAKNSIDRLISLCKKAGANHYLSGPTAKSYIGEGKEFLKAGIKLSWMSYPRYPKYSGEPDINLSIIDLLFNVGPQATEYILTTDGKN